MNTDNITKAQLLMVVNEIEEIVQKDKFVEEQFVVFRYCELVDLKNHVSDELDYYRKYVEGRKVVDIDEIDFSQYR